MKRIISMLLLLVLIIGMIPMNVSAATAVQITKQPASVTVAEGETAKVSFTATGDGLTYTWYYKNKGSSSFRKTSTFTSNSYSVEMNEDRDGRQIYCVVKDKYGNSAKTNTVTLSMGNVVKITKQPASVTAANGATAKVSFTATGDGLTYTWYFKHKGSSSFHKTTTFTGNSYSMEMNADRDGRQVYCVVKDKYGNSVKTNTVTLSMTSAVKITKQPATSVTVAEGETAKVSFTATGDGLTYTWYYKNKGSSSFRKTSTFTSNSYSVEMNEDRDGRQIYCVVTDKYGNSAKTNTVTLSMTSAVKITKQPATSVTAANGATAKVSFTATGDGLTYTWYYKNKGSSSFRKTSTFTSNSYSVEMNEDRDGRQIYCVVKDKYGNSVKTNTVTLSMTSTVKITKQPESVTVANGETAEVSFTATGDGLTYTWYFKHKGSSSFHKTSTFTSNSYSVEMSADRDGRQVYCVVKDQYGNSVQTNTVTLSMSSMKVVTQPQNAFCSVGDTASFTVAATGDTAPYTYHWQYYSSAREEWSDDLGTWAIGADTATLSFEVKAIEFQYEYWYRCVITDTDGNEITTNAVRVIKRLVITTQPQSVDVASGSTAETFVVAEGEDLQYQWYYTTNGSSREYLKSSVTTATYSITMNSSCDGRQVYCVITDKHGNSVTSDTVSLSITKLQIATQPKNVYANYGDRVSFTVKATGGTAPYTYRWQYRNNSSDWTNISQADWATGADTYTLSFNVDENEFTHGYQYRCIIIDAEETQVTSDAVRVTRPLTITTQPKNAFVRMGDTAVFSVEVAGGKAPYTYSWETFYEPRTPGDWRPALASSYPGMSGSDTTQLNVVIKELHFDRAYRFRCVITDADGNKVISNEVVPELNTKPRLLITSQPQNASAYVGDDVSFNVGVGGGTYPYSLQWQYSCYGSGWYNLSGATGYKYSFTVTDEREFDDEYCYRCVVTDADGESIISDVVRVLKPFVITSQPKNAGSAAGNTVTFSVKVTGGLAPYTYEWVYSSSTSGVWHYPSEAELAAGVVSGDKAATLSYKVSEGAVENNVCWRCFITDATGNRVETDVAYVIAPLTITKQPKSQTGKDGDTLSYTVEVAGGTAPYTYQWYSKAQSGQWIESTTNSATYKFEVNMITVQQAYSFYCVITDADGSTVITDTVTFKKS